MIRKYSELKLLKTFDERFAYLKLSGQVGVSSFGFERRLNQTFYTSQEWRSLRDKVTIRDFGCDLGIPGHEVNSRIIIHHMNPITIEDLKSGNSSVLDPNFLISVSNKTHLAIHFGDGSKLEELPIKRTKWDTVPWR